jgi:uncharacterized membrane protein
MKVSKPALPISVLETLVEHVFACIWMAFVMYLKRIHIHVTGQKIVATVCATTIHKVVQLVMKGIKLPL